MDKFVAKLVSPEKSYIGMYWLICYILYEYVQCRRNFCICDIRHYLTLTMYMYIR